MFGFDGVEASNFESPLPSPVCSPKLPRSALVPPQEKPETTMSQLSSTFDRDSTTILRAGPVEKLMVQSLSLSKFTCAYTPFGGTTVFISPPKTRMFWVIFVRFISETDITEAVAAEAAGVVAGDTARDPVTPCSLCMRAHNDERWVSLHHCKCQFHGPCLNLWRTDLHNCCPDCKAPISEVLFYCKYPAKILLPSAVKTGDCARSREIIEAAAATATTSSTCIVKVKVSNGSLRIESISEKLALRFRRALIVRLTIILFYSRYPPCSFCIFCIERFSIDSIFRISFELIVFLRWVSLLLLPPYVPYDFFKLYLFCISQRYAFYAFASKYFHESSYVASLCVQFGTLIEIYKLSLIKCLIVF